MKDDAKHTRELFEQWRKAKLPARVTDEERLELLEELGATEANVDAILDLERELQP